MVVFDHRSGRETYPPGPFGLSPNESRRLVGSSIAKLELTYPKQIGTGVNSPDFFDLELKN